MKLRRTALLATLLFTLSACDNTDQNAEVSIRAKDGSVHINSDGLEKITDSAFKGTANISISKEGNVSVNGKNVGVNIDTSGLNIKMKDGKGVQIDSGKIKVDIGGIKVDIQK